MWITKPPESTLVPISRCHASLPSNTMKKREPTLMTGKEFKRSNKEVSAQSKDMIYLEFEKRT